jgi:hypothetical protein
MSYKPHVLHTIESIPFASEESREKAREIAVRYLKKKSKVVSKKNRKPAKQDADKQAASSTKSCRIRA